MPPPEWLGGWSSLGKETLAPRLSKTNGGATTQSLPIGSTSKVTPLTMRGRLQGIFYDEFYMPWAVFDQLHHMLIGVKGFQDKKCGEGGRGMRTQPLLLKVCSLVYILTDGGARPVYCAAQCVRLSMGCVCRFHHAAVEHLYVNHFSNHVFLPQTQVRQVRLSRCVPSPAPHGRWAREMGPQRQPGGMRSWSASHTQLTNRARPLQRIQAGAHATERSTRLRWRRPTSFMPTFTG